MTFHAGKRKKGMGICLVDGDHDCLTNLRFADDVLLCASTKEQLQKMLCDFTSRKNEDSQQPKLEQ